MSDLLVQRLKAAKRELTALKTAHRRGLGGMKVFEYPLSISGYNDYVYALSVTIRFASGSTSYPFVVGTPQSDPNTNYLSKADLISMRFEDGGMSAAFDFDWFALTKIDPYTIYFYSSSPIEEVTYTFTRST